MAFKKIKVIVKEPGENVGHVEVIKNDLQTLQRYVGGLIECLTLGKVVVICNEEGKIFNLPENFIFGIARKDVIVGTAVICGTNGDGEFADIPLTVEQWTDWLKSWGNEISEE